MLEEVLAKLFLEQENCIIFFWNKLEGEDSMMTLVSPSQHKYLKDRSKTFTENVYLVASCCIFCKKWEKNKTPEGKSCSNSFIQLLTS